LQAILSNGVATVRQILRPMFSAMAAERAKKRRKLVLGPGYDTYSQTVRFPISQTRNVEGVLVSPLAVALNNQAAFKCLFLRMA
jgi:hypothetical protein